MAWSWAQDWLAAWVAESLQDWTPEEAASLRSGQLFFYATFVVPTVLYDYRCGPDQVPRFPATIRFTIRAGLPKWTHHAIWFAGWHCVLTSLARRPLGLLFASQMVATGMVATMLAPCGHSRALDLVHYASALAYMLDHIAMLAYWRMASWVWAGFGASLLAFVLAFVAKESYRARHGIKAANGASAEAIASASAAKLGPPDDPRRDRLWSLEAMEMACEFGLFFFFVRGMSTGGPWAGWDHFLPVK